MPPKGVSYDEKRKRLLEIFHESKDFYQLKDLEKIAPKTKGIIMQSVKEVLQSLVDDDLVTQEKIGISNYFWSFPSQTAIIRRNKLALLREERDKLSAKKNELQAAVTEATIGREPSDERTQQLAELMTLEERRAGNLKELEQFRENDPAIFEQKQQAVRICRDAANRWTENVFILQGYCNRQFNFDTAEFNRQFGVPDNFDTV